MTWAKSVILLGDVAIDFTFAFGVAHGFADVEQIDRLGFLGHIFSKILKKRHFFLYNRCIYKIYPLFIKNNDPFIIKNDDVIKYFDEKELKEKITTQYKLMFLNKSMLKTTVGIGASAFILAVHNPDLQKQVPRLKKLKAYCWATPGPGPGFGMGLGLTNISKEEFFE